MTLDRQGEGLFDKMNGIGAHEVVIESPRHEDTLATMARARRRAGAVGVPRARAGSEARSALSLHDHFQEPRSRRRRVARALAHRSSSRCRSCRARCATRWTGRALHYQTKERCVFCDILRQETDEGRRLIAENADVVAVAPYAPRFPFETWILPKRHQALFEDAPRHEYASLARCSATSCGG